jgi:hypothetical protein
MKLMDYEKYTEQWWMRDRQIKAFEQLALLKSVLYTLAAAGFLHLAFDGEFVIILFLSIPLGQVFRINNYLLGRRFSTLIAKLKLNRQIDQEAAREAGEQILNEVDEALEHLSPQARSMGQTAKELISKVWRLIRGEKPFDPSAPGQ